MGGLECNRQGGVVPNWDHLTMGNQKKQGGEKYMMVS